MVVGCVAMMKKGKGKNVQNKTKKQINGNVEPFSLRSDVFCVCISASSSLSSLLMLIATSFETDFFGPALRYMSVSMLLTT